MHKYDTIYYDIVGVCNAKCPYCLSGLHKTTKGTLVTPDSFRQTIETIRKLDILNTHGVVGLYNWGEPFLHPHLDKLLHIINEQDISYSFSTNASKLPVIDSLFVKNLNHIIFSMSGFSQESYNKIHGFDFQKILKNIQTIVESCRHHGFKGDFYISYHVYQFNVDEMKECSDFAQKTGIVFRPYYAILNNWWHINALIDNTLEYQLLRKVSEELFMFGFSEKLSIAPKEYSCPQYNLLSINENSEVLICCQVPSTKEFSCGNLLKDNFEEILAYRHRNQTCKECIEKGLAYYFHNSLTPPTFYEDSIDRKIKNALNKVSEKVKNRDIDSLAATIGRYIGRWITQKHQ